MFGNFYQNKSVFVTGHTGFKGSWLSAWLLKLGAKVTGYALAPAYDERAPRKIATSANLCESDL
jgi:CDP-glucose 4,6-dehydratase